MFTNKLIEICKKHSLNTLNMPNYRFIPVSTIHITIYIIRLIQFDKTTL